MSHTEDKARVIASGTGGMPSKDSPTKDKTKGLKPPNLVAEKVRLIHGKDATSSLQKGLTLADPDEDHVELIEEMDIYRLVDAWRQEVGEPSRELDAEPDTAEDDLEGAEQLSAEDDYEEAREKIERQERIEGRRKMSRDARRQRQQDPPRVPLRVLRGLRVLQG